MNLQESGENSSSTRLRKRSSQDGSPQLGRINRSYSASSSSSINEKERRPSQFLDLPPMVTWKMFPLGCAYLSLIEECRCFVRGSFCCSCLNELFRTEPDEQTSLSESDGVDWNLTKRGLVWLLIEFFIFRHVSSSLRTYFIWPAFLDSAMLMADDWAKSPMNYGIMESNKRRE